MNPPLATIQNTKQLTQTLKAARKNYQRTIAKKL